MFKKILVSRYQLIKILGRGAFGKTYLAKDILLPNKPLCVVKKLNPTIKDDKLLTIARRLFQTEAESLQKLGEHPQIPRFIAHFEEGNKFYLVQQYIEGHSLSEEIQIGNPWSESEVIELLQDCLNILKFIHAQNVIHRDVKPDNLIRNKENNRLVLVDFGAVKEAISQSKIASTIAIGTQGYMPSEQAMGKPRFNSDIYALGIIAIRALTGLETSYFKEDRNGNIFWEKSVNINPKLVKIVNKMTRYHFKERYDSAQQVLQDLQSLEAGYNCKKPQIFVLGNSLLARFKSSAKTVINRDRKPNLNLPKTEVPTYRSATVISNQNRNNSRDKIKLPRTIGIASIATLGIILGAMQLLSHQKQKRIANALNLMATNYERQEYENCLDNARLEAPEIGVPQEKINSFIGKCTLGIAKQEAENENYKEAIATAVEIPQNNPFAAEARENIDRWSQILLDRATKTYEREGQLANIKPIIASIPSSSPVKEEALNLSEQWQTEITNSEQILADANQAMTAKKWLDAIEKANEIKTVSDSVYWQERADKIASEAKENREKELAAARQKRIQNTRSRSYRRPSYQKPVVRQRTVRQQPGKIYRRRVRQRTIIRRETRIIRRTCRGYGCRR
ncbi:MAG: protein kinase [Prochloraceae cyanobacterium]